MKKIVNLLFFLLITVSVVSQRNEKVGYYNHWVDLDQREIVQQQSKSIITKSGDVHIYTDNELVCKYKIKDFNSSQDYHLVVIEVEVTFPEDKRGNTLTLGIFENQLIIYGKTTLILWNQDIIDTAKRL